MISLTSVEDRAALLDLSERQDNTMLGPVFRVTGLLPPQLQLTTPAWVTTPSHNLMFGVCLFIYYISVSGVTYDLVNSPPAFGVELDSRGHSRPVAIMQWAVRLSDDNNDVDDDVSVEPAVHDRGVHGGVHDADVWSGVHHPGLDHQSINHQVSEHCNILYRHQHAAPAFKASSIIILNN